MLVDEAKVKVKAGDGGNGCMAFRREKFVAHGGPSGGDGGRGGDVVIRATRQHNTLLHFRHKREQKAERGRHGLGSNCTGRSGEDLILEVPVGTEIIDQTTGEQIADMVEYAQEFVVAKGGRGGRGNARFASSTNQAPRRADPGEPGKEHELRFELKLLADVGLVGFPNAGKSTLISRISAAHPKIADYPFTTLEPNLGVVSVDEYDSFVVADIPGIIEGAHEGLGLGLRFLRHIERTRMLAHLIDVSDFSERDPIADYEVIVKELESFSEKLAQEPMVVVATKADSVQDPSRIDALRTFCEAGKMSFFVISSVTGEGVDELKRYLGEKVRAVRSEEIENSPRGAAIDTTEEE
jgi:GTP-binding protein